MRRAGPTRSFLRWFVLNRTIHSPAAFFPTRIRILTPRHHLTLITCALSIKIHKCATAGPPANILCGEEKYKSKQWKYKSKAIQIQRCWIWNMDLLCASALKTIISPEEGFCKRSIRPKSSQKPLKCWSTGCDAMERSNLSQFWADFYVKLMALIYNPHPSLACVAGFWITFPKS